ncbi:hypothetical protein K458DRAFT_244451, partial [Lentithecium fluviatile CBS 122367]
AEFCKALDAVLQTNSPENIQICTKWIVKHIGASSSCIRKLGEYLVALSKSFPVEPKGKGARAARSRLDILRVVSNVLHADKYHEREYEGEPRLAGLLEVHIEELLYLAAMTATHPLHKKELKTTINFWASSGCVNARLFNSFRNRAEDGLVVAQGGKPALKRTYALPDWFGGLDLPWYELPASYMLEHLIKDPDEAIITHYMLPSKFTRARASGDIIDLVDEFMDNIDLVYKPTGENPTGETSKYWLWLDPVGQIVKQDKATGEVKTVCNGYGWSMKFCHD